MAHVHFIRCNACNTANNTADAKTSSLECLLLYLSDDIIDTPLIDTPLPKPANSGSIPRGEAEKTSQRLKMLQGGPHHSFLQQPFLKYLLEMGW